MIALENPSIYFPFIFIFSNSFLFSLHQINTCKTSSNSTILYCWISLSTAFQWQQMLRGHLSVFLHSFSPIFAGHIEWLFGAVPRPERTTSTEFKLSFSVVDFKALHAFKPLQAAGTGTIIKKKIGNQYSSAMYFCKSSETSKVFLLSSLMAQSNISSYISSGEYEHEAVMNGMRVEVDW